MPAAPVVAASAAEREKARLEALREKRAALERELKEKERSRDAAADRLRETEKAISVAGRTLRALGQERAAAHAELTTRERELERLERRIVADQERLARLLRHQFRQRAGDALVLLMAGGDPNLTARDRHFLALVSRAQAGLIAGLRRDAVERRSLAAEVRRRGEALAELARREERERGNLRQRQQERQSALARLGSEIGKQKRAIGALKKDERRLTSLIASLAKRAAKAKRPPASPSHGKMPRPVEPKNATGAFAALRGKLAWPVAGTVAGRFGARRDADQTTWKGLFIRAAEGADVRAVAAGEVVFADWLRGYGNLLIIDHDDEFLSVYGNNQSLLADVGQKVGAGVTVATVGASGGQPESGLYFELRHRGQAFDPGRWLGPR